MSSAALARAGLAALALGAIGCGAKPEIFLSVTTDLPIPSALNGIKIQAFQGPDSDLPGLEIPLPVACVAVTSAAPQTLGLTPGAGWGSRSFRVVATGWASPNCGGSPLVTRSATVRFPDSGARLLALELVAACAGVSCPGAGTTCIAGPPCVDDTIASLPAVDGGN